MKLRNLKKLLLQEVIGYDLLTALGISDRDRSILYDLLYDNCSIRDIAREYNLSKRRIRQILKEIVGKIRSGLYEIRKYGLPGKLFEQIAELKADVDRKAMYINQCGLSLASIEDLRISNRCYNILFNAGLVYVEEFNLMPKERLLMLKGFGEQSLKELENELKKYGIKLRDQEI